MRLGIDNNFVSGGEAVHVVLDEIAEEFIRGSFLDWFMEIIRLIIKRKLRVIAVEG